MVFIDFPCEFAPRRLPFFLALEEWVADNLPKTDDYFFTWQQSVPTVICGRNQDIPKEVDVDYCRRNGIDIVRRRSGGGAVVADDNNMMLSYVAPRGEASVDETFARWTEMIAATLRKLGVEAQATGRNDVCIRGRKVSGGAFYAHPAAFIAHCTLILRPLPERITRALTPDRAKLASKGVTSVDARITSLAAEGPTASREDITALFRREHCTRSLTLTPEDIAQVEAIEQKYYQP